MINQRKLTVRPNRVKYFKQQLSLSSSSFLFFVFPSFFVLRRIHSTQQITFLRSLTSPSDVKRARLSGILFVAFVKRSNVSNANIDGVIGIESFERRNNKHHLRNNLQVCRFLEPLHGFHQKLHVLYRLLCYITQQVQRAEYVRYS